MATSKRIINTYGGLLDRIDLGATQVGIIKDTTDNETMGRIKVWIKGSNSIESDPSGWILCNYASPFAGASDPQLLGNATQDPNSTQTSYGIWAVPPDVGNSVLVTFVNKDPSQCYWFSCIYQKDMNNMIPGIAAGNSFQTSQYGADSAVPVSEYNKLGNTTNQSPAYSSLADGLKAQGLISDDLRGAGSSSARREAPSFVSGWLTPGGNQFIMDDGEGSQLIRLRTASGVQLLLSETQGHIYAITQNGSNWIELNNDGNIYLYGAGFSVRSTGDINLSANGNVNIEGAAVNIKSSSNMNIQSATANVNILAQNAINMQAVNQVLNLTTNGNNVFNYNVVLGTPSAPVAPTITQQSILNPATGQEIPTQSICSAVPDHEPWSGHGGGAPESLPTPVQGDTNVSVGSVIPNASTPLPLVGSPSGGMSAGVWTPSGYDAKGNPMYTYQGTSTALVGVNTLTTSQAGLNFIAQYEGFRSNVYLDAVSKRTIGYGHLIIPSDPPNIQTGPISQSDALVLLASDVTKAESAIRGNVTVPLTQAQFDALVSFTFNVGNGAFKNSTLLKQLNAGNYSQVPSEFMKWVHGNGQVIQGLVTRRRAEALVFATPTSAS